MRQFTSFFTLLAFGAMFVSCGESNTPDADGFVEVENIYADSIAINEILSPENQVLTKNYALISSTKNNKVIFRYQLPNWEFVDTTFSKGSGPKDVHWPVFMSSNNPSTDDIWMHDPAKSQMRQLSVSNDSISVLKTLSGDQVSGISIGSGMVVDDRYMLTSKLNRDTKREYLYVRDLQDSLRVVDSIPSLSIWDVQTTKIEGGISIMAKAKNYGQFKVVGDRIAYVYTLLGTTQIYNISPEGRLTHTKTIGNDYTYEQVAAMDFGEEKNEYTAFEKASDKHLYFMYTNGEKIADPQNPGKEKANFLSREIRIYDWDMKSVKKLILDKKNINTVLINHSKGEIYGWDKSLDFEQVYVYKYKI